jgi:hypothetical protein
MNPSISFLLILLILIILYTNSLPDDTPVYQPVLATVPMPVNIISNNIPSYQRVEQSVEQQVYQQAEYQVEQQVEYPKETKETTLTTIPLTTDIPLPTPVLPAVNTVPMTRKVAGNNGSVSCNTYCGGTGGLPWNGELPVSWNGARCLGTDNPEVSCDEIANSKGFNRIGCVCISTGTGWK